LTVHQLRPGPDLGDPGTCALDLANPKPKEVLALVEAFEAYAKANPLPTGAPPVTTGWNEITPAIALDLLKRNRPGANRKIDPATVFYYANQMARGDWKATGQSVLIDADGVLQDAQHRLYAGLVSGATFNTFVVTGIDPIKNMFAYIDNSRARTPASALQTAGLDGVSSVIAKVIKIGEEVRHGVYNTTGTKLARMSPADVLHLIDSYPNAQKAARSAASDWSEAVSYIGCRKETVAYLGMRIIDLHGEGVADDFFEEVAMDDDQRNADDPITALRKEIDKNKRAEKPMKQHHLLGTLIKAFNAWLKHEALPRRWQLLVNEDFPEIERESPVAVDAAE